MTKEKFKKIELVNRKAAYEYSFIKTYEAGVILAGTEVKSVRLGAANLNDAYCFFKDDELYVKSMLISEYKYGTHYNHEDRRMRKLLLKKVELKALARKVMEKGFTIVPYKIYTTERGHVKLEIVLAQGKKSFDKRDSIKEKDNKRELDRIKKIMK
jgi:SsrA-binding protein